MFIEQLSSWWHSWLSITQPSVSTVVTALATISLLPLLRFLYNKTFRDWNEVYSLIGNEEADVVLRSRLSRPTSSLPSSADSSRGAADDDHIDALPPPYPNGWYKLLDSHLLAPGQLRHVTALGKQYCVFRSGTADGARVCIMDSHCPHLGTNIPASGGIVAEKGNKCEIECPFHGWRFSGITGKCTLIPYSSNNAADTARVPPMKVYHSRDVNGMIWVWYSSGGGADDTSTEPSYELPRIPQLSQNLTYRGRQELHIHAHIRDTHENGADYAHLQYLHRPYPMWGSILKSNFGGKWSKNPLELNDNVHKYSLHGGDSKVAVDGQQTVPQHMASGIVSEIITFELFDGKIKIPLIGPIYNKLTQIGPSLVVHEISAAGKGKNKGKDRLIALMLQTVTPGINNDPYHLQNDVVLHSPWYIPSLIGNIMLHHFSGVLLQDRSIWMYKTVLRNPHLVRDDGPVLAYRRWFSQFYDKHSVTMRDALRQMKVGGLVGSADDSTSACTTAADSAEQDHNNKSKKQESMDW